MSKAEAFLKTWLGGYTCSHQADLSIFWKDDNDRFVVMKHAGHSTYCGRALGTMYCETYYSLYDLDKKGSEGDKFVKQWKGRFKKEYWDELHLEVTK